jgi:DNA-binding MarR family transcriptional regulator
MSNLYRLDEVKGTIRLLHTLYDIYRPMTRLELLDELRKVNIGRTAAYRAIETLKDLGLIESDQKNYEGKRVIVTSITMKGIEIAVKLDEIKNMLDSKNK